MGNRASAILCYGISLGSVELELAGRTDLWELRESTFKDAPRLALLDPGALENSGCWILYAHNTVTQTEDWTPMTIDIDNMGQVDPSIDREIEAFCIKHSLPSPTPSWLLIPFYG